MGGQPAPAALLSLSIRHLVIRGRPAPLFFTERQQFQPGHHYEELI